MIPDAPWIRDAENYGMPPYDEPELDTSCPICGKEADEYFIDKEGNICGCEHCIQHVEAYDWQYEHMEEPDYA